MSVLLQGEERNTFENFGRRNSRLVVCAGDDIGIRVNFYISCLVSVGTLYLAHISDHFQPSMSPPPQTKFSIKPL